MAEQRKRILLITSEVQAEIRRMIERARAKPVPIDLVMSMRAPDQQNAVVTMKDRKRDAPRRPPSQSILIPDGYQVAFSFEEQPAGIVRHMSVAVEDGAPGAMPMPAAVEMIAREFGFREFPPELFWIEEFRPGFYAINFVELTEPKQAAPTRQ